MLVCRSVCLFVYERPKDQAQHFWGNLHNPQGMLRISKICLQNKFDFRYFFPLKKIMKSANFFVIFYILQGENAQPLSHNTKRHEHIIWVLGNSFFNSIFCVVDKWTFFSKRFLGYREILFFHRARFLWKNAFDFSLRCI